MSVAVIEPVGGHGGMNHYDVNLCHGLAQAGVDVALYTSDQTRTPEASTFRVRHTYKGIFGEAPVWKRGLRFVFGTALALGDCVMSRRRVCHFHLFGAGPLELMNVLCARALRRKVVITAHDVEAFASGLDAPGVPRLVYGLAHAVVAHNRISRDELLETMHVREERVAVIPHGNELAIAPKMVEQGTARRLLSLPERGPVLLFFGQIKDVKGLDVLLSAMPALLAHHPASTLVIAGRPWKTDFAKYRELIDGLGIAANCVTHIRYIPDEELPLYYSASDLVVLPYRRVYQSGVVLMAMSFGKAVLASDIPGMSEIITPGRTGYLFKTGDARDLAHTASRALASPEMLAQVARGGLELVRNEYGWDRIGRATAELYARILSAA